jgi:hypothetical protein
MLTRSLTFAFALLLAAGLAATAEARGKRYVPHGTAATQASPTGTTAAADAPKSYVVARRYGKR